MRFIFERKPPRAPDLDMQIVHVDAIHESGETQSAVAIIVHAYSEPRLHILDSLPFEAARRIMDEWSDLSPGNRGRNAFDAYVRDVGKGQSDKPLRLQHFGNNDTWTGPDSPPGGGQ